METLSARNFPIEGNRNTAASIFASTISRTLSEKAFPIEGNRNSKTLRQIFCIIAVRKEFPDRRESKHVNILTGVVLDVRPKGLSRSKGIETLDPRSCRIGQAVVFVRKEFPGAREWKLFLEMLVHRSSGHVRSARNFPREGNRNTVRVAVKVRVGVSECARNFPVQGNGNSITAFWIRLQPIFTSERNFPFKGNRNVSATPYHSTFSVLLKSERNFPSEGNRNALTNTLGLILPSTLVRKNFPERRESKLYS